MIILFGGFKKRKSVSTPYSYVRSDT